MNRLISELRALHEVAAVKKRDAEKVEARAFMEAAGAMDLRKWAAREAAADAKYEADLAERMVTVKDREVYAMGRRMDNGRTVASTSRKELETLGADL